MPIRDFNEAWNRIQRVAPGQEIKVWSAAGHVSGSFAIVSVDPKVIIVKTKRGDGLRQARKESAEKVFQLWDDYCRGDIHRMELTRMSRNSTYIISLLRGRGELRELVFLTVRAECQQRYFAFYSPEIH